MASPVVEQVVEGSNNTATTSHTINLPTATAGQLLLILLDKGSTAATFNAHASLTELLDENNGNGLYIAYRWMDGTEPSSYTLTSSANTRSAYLCYRISGALNPSAQAPVIGTTGTGTSATPDPPSSAAPSGTKDYLFIALAGMAGEEADDDTWGNTPPTNYTPSPPRQKSCGTAGTNLGGLILGAERQLTTGSAQDPGTFGVDVSAAWRAQTILVYPQEPVTVTPTTAALTTSLFAPTVTATQNQKVTPTTLALTTSLFAPTVSTPRLVVPGVLALALTTFAPTVTASSGTVVTPTTAALITALFAPTVTASDHKLVTPPTLALTTSLFAPTVTATQQRLVTPPTLALTLTTYAPTVTATGAVAPGPPALPQHRLFMLPLRRPKPEPVRVQIFCWRPRAYVDAVAQVELHLQVLAVAHRRTLRAHGQLCFRAQATMQSARRTLALTAVCDHAGWLAQRRREDQELLEALQQLLDRGAL